MGSISSIGSHRALVALSSIVLVAIMADEGDNNDVFVYMGGDQQVPWDVTHVRVHKSVKIIPFRAFFRREHLVSVEMHDGVEIIEEGAFNNCNL